MARTAGKHKTRKSFAKRFKMTGTGKVLRRKQGKRHLMRRKNAKRCRGLRQAAVVAECDMPRIKENMPFA